MSTEAFFTISPGKIVKIGLQKSVFYNSAAGQDWAAGPPTWIVPHRACPAFAQGAPEAKLLVRNSRLLRQMVIQCLSEDRIKKGRRHEVEVLINMQGFLCYQLQSFEHARP